MACDDDEGGAGGSGTEAGDGSKRRGGAAIVAAGPSSLKRKAMHDGGSVCDRMLDNNSSPEDEPLAEADEVVEEDDDVVNSLRKLREGPPRVRGWRAARLRHSEDVGVGMDFCHRFMFAGKGGNLTPYLAAPSVGPYAPQVPGEERIIGSCSAREPDDIASLSDPPSAQATAPGRGIPLGGPRAAGGCGWGGPPLKGWPGRLVRRRGRQEQHRDCELRGRQGGQPEPGQSWWAAWREERV